MGIKIHRLEHLRRLAVDIHVINLYLHLLSREVSVMQEVETIQKVTKARAQLIVRLLEHSVTVSMQRIG
jgi:hypothetical protein